MLVELGQDRRHVIGIETGTGDPGCQSGGVGDSGGLESALHGILQIGALQCGEHRAGSAGRVEKATQQIVARGIDAVCPETADGRSVVVHRLGEESGTRLDGGRRVVELVGESCGEGAQLRHPL